MRSYLVDADKEAARKARAAQRFAEESAAQHAKRSAPPNKEVGAILAARSADSRAAQREVDAQIDARDAALMRDALCETTRFGRAFSADRARRLLCGATRAATDLFLSRVDCALTAHDLTDGDRSHLEELRDAALFADARDVFGALTARRDVEVRAKRAVALARRDVEDAVYVALNVR